MLTSRAGLERPLHLTASSMTHSQYLLRHRLRTSPTQPRATRFDPAPGDSPQVLIPEEEDWYAARLAALPAAQEQSNPRENRHRHGPFPRSREPSRENRRPHVPFPREPSRENRHRHVPFPREPFPSTSRNGTGRISHSATEARPRPLKPILKKPKRMSHDELVEFVWGIMHPKPKTKRVTFAPDVKKGDDDTKSKPMNYKQFKCISPPGKVYPFTPGRSVDQVLADISHDYDYLTQSRRFSPYSFDPEVRNYLISRMETARQKVAAAQDKSKYEWMYTMANFGRDEPSPPWNLP